MTTNVLDLRNGIAATDSRWSIDTMRQFNFFVFVDDVQFDKIVEKYRYISVFAGNASLIQRFKDWIETDGATAKPTDEEIEGLVAVTITDMDSGIVLFERTQAHPLPDARFAGTGATQAMLCWLANGCAKTAVSSAILMDRYSGGEIKYYAFSGEHNLAGNLRHDCIAKAMCKRGFIMYKESDQKAIPIQDAAATDPRVQSLLDEISNGKLEPCAPCAEMYLPWSADEKRRLDRALSLITKPR